MSYQKLKIGKLNRKIKLISSETYTDEIGCTNTRDVEKEEIWCRFTPITNKVLTIIDNIQYSNIKQKITIRYEDYKYYGIDFTWKVKYTENEKERVMYIETIVNPFEENKTIELYVSEDRGR